MKFTAPLDWIRKKLKNRFIRNLGWLGGAEMFNRVFRLATTVILARFLTESDYGLGAIVLTIHEFAQTFSRVGIGAKLIQADEEDLEELCESAYWLNWVIFGGLFVVQCILSFPIALFYQDNRLILPICASAIIYLMLPVALVQAALVNRENRLKVAALNNSVQLTASNIASAILAVLGFGMWAIVLPRVLSTPIWIYIYLKNHSWRPSKGFTTHRWNDIFGFGRNYLGIQLLKTARDYMDYLIVGRFVGIKELGVYYFAFNAGLGISLSITRSITTALFPHLCEVRSNLSEFKKRYIGSLKTIALIIIPFVILQSSLAPFYVPIVFGEKWINAIPVLVLICLSAIPRPFADAASQLLIAIGRPELDLRWNTLFTLFFAGGLLIGVRWQAIGVAWSVLIIHAVCLPLFVIWATYYVFCKLKPQLETTQKPSI